MAERDAKDFAIEFGRYLANAAEEFIATINDTPNDYSDAWRGLERAIYEFRKRADKVQ